MGKSYGKLSYHNCELNIDNYGLSKLPPNAPWYQRLGRKLRTQFTVNTSSAVAKRFYRNKSAIINERKRHLRGYGFIIHPFSNANLIKEFLFFLLWTFEIFVTPFAVGYLHYFQPQIKKRTYLRGNWTYALYRLFICPLEIVCCLTDFITGYVNKKNKEIVIDPVEIARHYLLTYFVVDLISMRKPGIYDSHHMTSFCIRLFCLFRTPTVFDFLRQIMLNFKVREEIYACIKLFILTFFLINLSTCLFYYWFMLIYKVGIHEYKSELTFPPRSWITRAGILPQRCPVFSAYRITLSMIVCHFFGAGLGKIPILDEYVEGPILTVVMIVGRLWTLYVLAYLLKIFSAVAASESKYEEYLSQLEVFMRQKRLPRRLKSRLTEYYKYKYQYHYFNERAMFSTLSEYLRQEILLFRARKMISKVELFRSFPQRIIGQIIGSSKQVVYLTNDIIAKIGDPIEEIYFISCGTVAVFSKDNIELSHLEDGEEIGLYSSLNPDIDYYKFNYVATETSEVYVVSKKNFRATVFDQEDLLKFFSKKLQEVVSSYHHVEEEAKNEEYDFLSELRGGNILEPRKYRETQFEDF